MSEEPRNKDILRELDTFLRELETYRHLQQHRISGEQLKKDELRLFSGLTTVLPRKVGRFKQLITELTGSAGNIWQAGLAREFDDHAEEWLGTCIDVTNEAIGKLEDDIEKGRRDAQTGELLTKTSISGSESPNVLIVKSKWKDIENEYGVTKNSFGKQINFVSDSFKRAIIFRDIEQAFILANSGFAKPAVILAGGVIEELLRLYLTQNGISPQKPLKKDFKGYIQTCEQNKLLKSGTSHLSDSARHFRNIVHLSKEVTKKHTISKATAKGAVSSIFTVANDF